MESKRIIITSLLVFLMVFIGSVVMAGKIGTEARLTDIKLMGHKSEIEPYKVQLNEQFTLDRTDYTVLVNSAVNELDIIPIASSTASISVEGIDVESGTPYQATLASNETTVSINISQPDKASSIYTVTIKKKDMSRIYTSEKLADGVWRISDYAGFPGFENMYLIEGEEKALLIDTGMGKGDLAGYVRTLTELPIEVALTHRHGDHVKQIGQFPDSTVYMSAIDADRLDVNKDNFVMVNDGDIIDLGGRQIEVIDVPGHTLGSIALLDAKNKFLAISDAVGSGSYVWMQIGGTTPLETYVKSLKHLEEKIKGFYTLTFLVGHSWQEQIPLSGLNGKQLVTDMRIVAEKVVSGQIQGNILNDFRTANYGFAGLWYNPDHIYEIEN